MTKMNRNLVKDIRIGKCYNLNPNLKNNRLPVLNKLEDATQYLEN